MGQLLKAIFIDDNTQDSLISWYDDDLFDGLIKNSLGYYLVSEFASPGYMILDKKTLDENYTTTGKQLQHGYFEVEAK